MKVSWRVDALMLATLVALGACGNRQPAAEPPAAGHMASIPATVTEWARGAVLFDGLGSFHRAIASSSPDTQRYFDQGMRFLWAFNHDEAARSFAKAAELEPDCSICFWGLSLAVGPNYNLPFLAQERAAMATLALAKARERLAKASPVDQALIEALALRYPAALPLDPLTVRPVLKAYAEAMKAVAGRFPDDLDVQTLYAEALMNVNPWKLWNADGSPAPGTDEILGILESVQQRDPSHPGANHYYIHAVEASPHPERALAAAGRVKSLMPAAGHLVHMPAHIMQRVGRYEEAADANRLAAAADQAYQDRASPLDYYPVMYTAHNYQFLAYSAAMEGRKAEAVSAADRSRSTVSDAMLLSMPGADWYVGQMYTARVRFGMWNELLSMPPPNDHLPGLTGAYLYARSVALAATGRVAEARAVLLQLQAYAAALTDEVPAGQNTLKAVLAIAIPVAQARIAAAEHRPTDAVALLRQAVAAEDRIAYDEPKNWFFPTRHVLGAQLIEIEQSAEAEVVYREDLRQNPANGWALHGLMTALRSQGKAAEAAKLQPAFDAAWQHADVTLAALAR